MYYSGFADEAGSSLDVQIKATKTLGWKYIETRNISGKNLASLTDKEFEEVCEKLEKSGISFNCYGSGVANWAKPITEPPDSSYDEMRKAIPRMQKLGIKMIRIMSFAVPQEIIPRNLEYADEVIKRLKVIVKMAEDGGVICVMENCNNWGGLSYEHTLKIMDAIKSPALKLVFDTGNPVKDEDVRGNPPYKKQSSWEFYNNVKEHVIYVHIKDGINKPDGKTQFVFPGEGEGDVEKILRDLFKRGYDGGFSIEPHMVSVYHDKTGNEKEEAMFENYIEYGKRLMSLIERIKKS